LKVYLDTSVILAFLLEGNDCLVKIPQEAEVGSSRLMWIELARVLERTIQSGTLTGEQVAAVRQSFESTSAGMVRLKINEAVQRRAEGSFPLVIKTLDALHLATAMEWSGTDRFQNMEIWTLDRQFNLCASAMGFVTPLLKSSRSPT
jgi:predicted nucleic acid-binding protein